MLHDRRRAERGPSASEPVPSARATFREKCSTVFHHAVGSLGIPPQGSPGPCDISRKVFDDVTRPAAIPVVHPGNTIKPNVSVRPAEVERTRPRMNYSH